MRSFSIKDVSQAPTLGVRRRSLGSRRELIKSRELLYKVLKTDYHLAILTAAIKALNCEILEIARNEATFVSIHEEYRYVRDPVVVFHDKKIVIHCLGNGEFGSHEILKQFEDYEKIMINDAYFEGGNLFYLPSLNKIFHGMTPGGYYAKREGLLLSKMSPENYYKVIPAVTNQRLQEQLAPHKIDVEGLELNPDVINQLNHEGQSIALDHYYHLDCFMQLLPDGRLIILNKKILTEASWTKLESLLGDKLIDLGYENYLSSPVIFNSVVICKEDETYLIAPNLPKIIRESLAKLNLIVITPETLTVGSEYYQENYARKVAEILQNEGYTKANKDNLATKLAKNQKGYRCNNGKLISEQEVKSLNIPLNRYKRSPISFLVDGGGPHCLTTEIVPNRLKVSENTSTLFNQNNIEVKASTPRYHFANMKF